MTRELMWGKVTADKKCKKTGMQGGNGSKNILQRQAREKNYRPVTPDGFVFAQWRETKPKNISCGWLALVTPLSLTKPRLNSANSVNLSSIKATCNNSNCVLFWRARDSFTRIRYSFRLKKKQGKETLPRRGEHRSKNLTEQNEYL